MSSTEFATQISMLQKEKRKGQKEVKLRFVRCYYQKVVKKKKKKSLVKKAT